MSSPPAKRVRIEYYTPAEDSREGYWDQETQQALEEIDACQNQIDLLNEKASEDILKVEHEFNKLRKPFFEKRNDVIQKIENFWITAFVNHPQITSLLDEDEEDCLHNLSKLEVEEFDDIKFGYRIKFHFEPNQYFENDVLTKEFHLGAPVPCSKSTPIRWKEGKNIVKLIQERNEKNQKQGRKRKAESRTFFTWYEEDCDPIADEIAEVIKDDLWPNPLQYYLSPDVEVDANGVEDDGGDDDDDASDDETVVILTNEDEEDEELIAEDDCSREGTLKSDSGSVDQEVESSAPTPETSAPTPEASDPTPETSDPTSEASDPTPETSDPTLETSAPTDETLAPTPETSTPAAETPAISEDPIDNEAQSSKEETSAE